VSGAELPENARALLDRAAAALPGEPAWIGLAPGRINIIGEHTDYIGGLSLPTGVDRYAVVRLRPREDRRVHIRALDLGEETGFGLDERPDPPAGWARTMAGAVWICHADFGLPGGFDAVVTGDVPRGGGMSSSAALCVAWVNALAAWAGRSLDDPAAARLAQKVEHDWSGVPCGLLDQLASQASRAGRLLRVDFQTDAVTPVAADLPRHAWLVLDTGVRRALAGSAYAERVAQVRAGLERAGVAHWRDLTQAHLVHGDVLDARLRHGITENARVDAVVAALAAGDVEAVGRLMGESHASLRDDYAVSCAELDTFVDAAAATPGCLGARMMGGGFGGCALALVEADRAEAVADAALVTYRSRFDHPASAAVVRGVDGARGWRA
jgi:galactokinase